jgi:virginiamycin B lyase
VIMGPDGAPWITDTGLNAIMRVDPRTSAVRRFEVPAGQRVGMHTAAFDQKGVLWFTGSDGFYGRLDPTSEPPAMKVYEAPRGGGPYGITVAPNGDVYFASLSQSYLAKVDPATGAATVIEPPTRDQGTRRVWSDSRGIIWSTQWNAGQIASYDPTTREWKERHLPGDRPQAYAIYVDERDIVWISDFGANAIVRFDPQTEEFTEFPLPSPNGSVRQLLGRPGEVWGAESSVDKLIVIRTG